MLYPVYLWKDPLGPGQKAREEHVAHHQRHHIGQQLSLHIHLAGRRPERSVKRNSINVRFAGNSYLIAKFLPISLRLLDLGHIVTSAFKI